MIPAMSGIPAGAGQLLGKRLGKYEILALLALGGTAEIYLARIDGAAGFEKYVVVKCLHDHLADDTEFVKMFLDEARLAAQLDHSNVVQTFELGEHENRYYMVLEFLAGLSLAMVVRRAAERFAGGRLPVPLILNIAAQACAGLHYAHERTSNGKPLTAITWRKNRRIASLILRPTLLRTSCASSLSSGSMRERISEVSMADVGSGPGISRDRKQRRAASGRVATS